MTCKDCLYYEVCPLGLEIKGKTGTCLKFKNKADFVEVKCRCEDCKHYKRYGRTSLVFEGKNIEAGWCYLRGKSDEEHRMLPFDFCSYGKRSDT